MKKNIAWFSIVMAMWIVLLITLLAFMILEYIIPFGRNVKGIENASKAYYQAETWIEQALYSLAKNDTGYSETITNTEVISYNYDLAWEGLVLPPIWEWNSEYASNWNIIAPGQPIQLEIGNLDTPIDWNTARFHFRIPDIWSSEDLAGGTWAIINWQLSSESDSLSASGSWISAEMISDYVDDNDAINMENFIWATLESGDISITDFYNQDVAPGITECGTDRECTLKFSIVNQLILKPVPWFTQWVPLPYLEWKFSFSTPVPLRYAWLTSEGTSYGFKKDLEIKVPQQTIVEAFDFTVFQ